MTRDRVADLVQRKLFAAHEVNGLSRCGRICKRLREAFNYGVDMYRTKTILSRSRNRPNQRRCAHYFHHLLHKCAAWTNDQRRPQHYERDPAVANFLLRSKLGCMIRTRVRWARPERRHLYETLHSALPRSLNNISRSEVMDFFESRSATLVNDPNQVDYCVASPHAMTQVVGSDVTFYYFEFFSVGLGILPQSAYFHERSHG